MTGILDIFRKKMLEKYTNFPKKHCFKHRMLLNRNDPSIKNLFISHVGTCIANIIAKYQNSRARQSQIRAFWSLGPLIFIKIIAEFSLTRNWHIPLNVPLRLKNQFTVLISYGCKETYIWIVYWHTFLFFFKSERSRNRYILEKVSIDLQWETSQMTLRAPVTWYFSAIWLWRPQVWIAQAN